MRLNAEGLYKKKKFKRGKNEKMLLTLVLMSLVVLCLAQSLAHPDWVSFERTSPTTGTIRWSSEPSFNVGYYYLGLHPTTTVHYAPAYCDPS